MEIMRKISASAQDMQGAPIPVITFLGDSVTQGCFEVFLQEDRSCETVFDQQHSCATYVSELLRMLYPKAHVCIVNAGISGDNVVNGAARLEKHVLRFHPDLTVVGYGLNDCNLDIDIFKTGLRDIFKHLTDAGSEVIYLTPNMMNTYVDSTIDQPEIRAIAEHTKTKQLTGVLTRFAEEGRKAAAEYGVRVCDMYEKWQLLHQNGVDTTMLLANRINHPDRRMNWMTAYEVLQAMMR